MIKQNKLILTTASLLVAAFLLITVLPKTFVGAATHTVTPAPNAIQTAIDAAVNGDIIEITAGTYDESLVVNKSLTLKGIGSVVIKSVNGDSSGKGIDIQNTSNVVLENLTFDGSNVVAPPTTGVDINSVDGITLTNIVVKNYTKNGISVVAQQDPSFVAGKNPVFNNVTVQNVGWAGIALYPLSTLGTEIPLTGVQFNGTTNISGTQYGIQFGDSNTTQSVTGPNNSPVDLGTVVFSNNQASITNTTGRTAALISGNSTIDGRPITATDFAGLNVNIESPTTTTPAPTAVPGVPNTGRL